MMEYPGDADAADLTPNWERPHVVLIGAGASYAAFPNGDKNGKKLPLMQGFVETVGMEPLAEKTGIPWQNRNFEDFYSELYDTPGTEGVRKEVEDFVFDYFASLELPDEPTIYDYLILGLRPKDVIATFNWDPFLYLAAKRNRHISNAPYLLYLHGNVAWKYQVAEDGRIRWVPSETSRPGYQRIPLLFPVRKKNYQTDPFIAKQWELVNLMPMPNAYVFTIFGYGAPSSDVEAVQLLQKGWGTAHDRNLEEIEIIDRPDMDPDTLQARWDPFIHTHHYRTTGDYFESTIAQMPRRTCEGMFTMLMGAQFIKPNPQPEGVSLADLQAWHTTLVENELRYELGKQARAK